MTTPFTPSHSYASVPSDAVQAAKIPPAKSTFAPSSHAFPVSTTGTPNAPGPETTPGLAARVAPATALPGLLGGRPPGSQLFAPPPTTPHQVTGAPSAPSSVPSSGGLSAEPATFGARHAPPAPLPHQGVFAGASNPHTTALGAAIGASGGVGAAVGGGGGSSGGSGGGSAKGSTTISPTRLPPIAVPSHLTSTSGYHHAQSMSLSGQPQATHSHMSTYPHPHPHAHAHTQGHSLSYPVPLTLTLPGQAAPGAVPGQGQTLQGLQLQGLQVGLPGQGMALPGTAAGRAGALHPALGHGSGGGGGSGSSSVYGSAGSAAPTPTSGGVKHRYATRDNYTSGAVGPLAGPLMTASGFPNGSGGGVFLTPQQQGQMYAATGGVVGLPYASAPASGAAGAAGPGIGIAGVGGLAGYDAADLAPLDADVVPAKGYYAVFHWEHFPEAPDRVRAKLPRQTKQLPSIPTLFHQLLLILEFAKQAACGEDVLHKLDRKIIKSTGRHAAPGVDPVPGLDAGTEPLFDTSGNWTNLAHPATRLRQLPVYDARGVEYAVVACRREHVTHIFASPEGAFLDRMGFCPRLLDVYYFTPTEVSCVGGRKVSGGALPCVCPGGIADEPDPEGLELELTGVAMTSGGEPAATTAASGAPAGAAAAGGSVGTGAGAEGAAGGGGGGVRMGEDDYDLEGRGRSDTSGDDQSLGDSEDDEDDDDDDEAGTAATATTPKPVSPHLAPGSVSSAAGAAAAKPVRKGGRKKRGKGRRRSPAWPSAKPVAVVASAPRATGGGAAGAGGAGSGALFSFGGLTSSTSSTVDSSGVGTAAGSTGSSGGGNGGFRSDPESGGDQSPVLSYLLDKYGGRGGGTALPPLRTPTRTPAAPAAAPASGAAAPGGQAGVGGSKGSPLLEAAAAASRLTTTPVRAPLGPSAVGTASPALTTPAGGVTSGVAPGGGGGGGEATATMLWLDMARKLELSQKQIDAAWRRKVAEQQRVGEAWRTQCQILRQRSDEWEGLFQRERAQNLALAARLANVERIVASFAAHGGTPASAMAMPPPARGAAAKGVSIAPPSGTQRAAAPATAGPIAKAAVAAAQAQAQAQAAAAKRTSMGMGMGMGTGGASAPASSTTTTTTTQPAAAAPATPAASVPSAATATAAPAAAPGVGGVSATHTSWPAHSHPAAVHGQPAAHGHSAGSVKSASGSGSSSEDESFISGTRLSAERAAAPEGAGTGGDHKDKVAGTAGAAGPTSSSDASAGVTVGMRGHEEGEGAIKRPRPAVEDSSVTVMAALPPPLSKANGAGAAEEVLRTSGEEGKYGELTMSSSGRATGP